MQGSAQVPLLSPSLSDSQQKPLEQLPLQHGVPPVLQVSPFGMHKGVVEVVLVVVLVVVPQYGLLRQLPWSRMGGSSGAGRARACSSRVSYERGYSRSYGRDRPFDCNRDSYRG